MPRAVDKLVASFQITPHGIEEGGQRELHLKPSILEQIELQAKLLNYFLGSNKSNINQSLRKVRMQAAVLRPIFQAFLYARSHVAVRVLKSACGHLIRWAEKENSDGRHIDTTFSA